MSGDVGSAVEITNEVTPQMMIETLQDQELLPLNREEEDFLMSEIMEQNIDDVCSNYISKINNFVIHKH